MKTKPSIFVPNRPHLISQPYLIRVFSDVAKTPLEGDWIVVTEDEPHVFTIHSENITERVVREDSYGDDIESLHFSSWDKEVMNIDKDRHNEVKRRVGVSDHLKWKDVRLTPYRFYAPSIERLREALKHVEFGAKSSQDEEYWYHGWY